MKVIFIEDVPEVAMAGDTREVADGYGRNYLLPKKLAILANSAASNVLEAQMKKVLVKRAQLAAEMTDLAGKLKGTEITLTAKVGESDRLYGSVTGADIAGEISRTMGLEVDKRKIEMGEPIRQLGTHDVTIRFSHDITAAIKVTVLADAVPAEKEEETEKKKKKAVKAEAEGEEPAAELEESEAEVTEPTAEAKESESEAGVTEPAAEVEVTEPEAEVKEPEAEEKLPEAETAEPEAEAGDAV